MRNGKIKVMIADDHRIFREGLKLILSGDDQIEIKGEASNGKELLSAVRQHAPDVIITDIKMPVVDGVEATRKLCRFYPGARVIGLTSFGDDHMIIDMLEAGAMGFLLKNIVHEELVVAIRTVYQHRPYFSAEITEKLSRIIAGRYVGRKEQHITLTELEKQIILLICKEYTSKEIADKLKMGKRTVESYRIRIMDKLGAKSVAGIITYAIQSGLYRQD